MKIRLEIDGAKYSAEFDERALDAESVADVLAESVRKTYLHYYSTNPVPLLTPVPIAGEEN
jgi:hypothetical protein